MESEWRKEFERLAVAWADDPVFANLARPEAALLVWDCTGERLLSASPAAGPLRDGLVLDEAGRLAPGSPAAERLRALGQGLAPRRGMRLERLRLSATRLDGPATCACRIATLPTGEEVLLTVLFGPVPKSAPRRFQARPASEPEPGQDRAPEPSSAGDPLQDVQARLSGRGVVRFVWQADPDTRFTAVSPALRDVVGPEGADIVGRTWADIAGVVVHDPSDAVTEHLANRETWSARRVLWRIEGGAAAVAVDLAGLPALDRAGELLGFRGFGLCRTDTVAPWPQGQTASADSQDASSAPGPPAKADKPPGMPDASDAVPGQEAPPQPAKGGEDGRSETPLETQPVHEDRMIVAPPAPQPLVMDLSGTVTARLGADRPSPLRAVEPDATFDWETGEVFEHADSERSARRGADLKPRLSITEQSAFREIARALGARYAGDDPPESTEEPSRSAEIVPARRPEPPTDPLRILDRLPAGVLIHRGEAPLFASRLLLDWVGYGGVEALAADGGVARLFRGRPHGVSPDGEGSSPLALSTREGALIPVDARLTTVEWDGAPASLMLIRRIAETDAAQRLKALELDLRAREARLNELSSILDTATDGVVTFDHAGRILSLNRSAEALFGYDQNEVTGEPITVLLAPESHAAALEYLGGLRADGMASLLNDGREVLGRVRQGGAIPLFMTVGHVSEGVDKKFCAVLRDVTAFKKAEDELLAAKRAAEKANAEKSDLLAKINHEIRTPLNAIIGFAEVMLEERFGPIGNERYQDYLKDVHASGRRIVNVVNDLLDLAKIEAGRVELAFTGVNLNAAVADCVAQMQVQAARARIVMRTSFAGKLPPVVADERSVRQIVANIVSNAIRFTDAGGQVIVSTAIADGGAIALRVRDTGVGMTVEEIAAALEPFRQLAMARRGDGTGLGLPLTKALVEANRGRLHITSARNQGTLVEVVFPPTRVLAQ